MERFDPYAPGILADPYPFYRRLRAEDPVHWGVAGDSHHDGMWYITRYADVVALLKDERLGREVYRVLPPEALPPISPTYEALFKIAGQWMVLRDPPEHTRLRSLVIRAFTPRVIERLAPFIEGRADALLDGLLPNGRMDLIADYASPLTVIATAELLGVPARDQILFEPWTRALATVIDLRQSEEIFERGRVAIEELCEYLRGIIAERRRRPREDLISVLIEGETHEDVVDEETLLGTLTQLLFGGYEPTTHLIGNGLLALLRHPDQLALLRSNPELIGAAVEETLRYDSSVQMTFRYALETFEFRGKLFRIGNQVALVMGAANRDPQAYCDPDRLDITRTPNRHSSFGHGMHFCVGAALARTIGQAAIGTVLQRLRRIEVQQEPLEWNETVAVRGLKALPVIYAH